MVDMSAIISAILSAVLTAVLTIVIQKGKSNNATKKNALYLYMNLKQIKDYIDRDKKILDAVGNDKLIFMAYFNPYDYMAFLCALKNKLTKDEIMMISNFYEDVKKLDNCKSIFGNVLNSYTNYAVMYPTMLNIYQNDYNSSFECFKNALNCVTNSEVYKSDIVKIMIKLQQISL